MTPLAVAAISGHTGSPPETYFQHAAETFARAVQKNGRDEDFVFEVDGVAIQLRFAGHSLARQITPTLAHLQVAATTPAQFTICCWDDAAAHADMPAPGAMVTSESSYGCLTDLSDARFRAFYTSWSRTLSCVDLQAHTTYCCYRNGAALIMYEVSAPLRSILNTMLNPRGLQLIHAAAVGTRDASLLLAGPAGSGKSTLSVLALQGGLMFQSDDLCLLTSEKIPRSLSLYQMAKLRENAIPRFPAYRSLLTHFEEGDEKKAYFQVGEHFPAQLLKAAPVRAILLPRITNEATSRLERARPKDVIYAVLSWTVKEVPKSDHLGEKIMLQAISRLPAYHFLLGRDENQTLSLMRELLS